MSTSKLFGKDILITSTTDASGTSIGSISTLGGLNVNRTVLISGALTSTADSNTIGSLVTTGGNIGIGTTAPVQVLDVNGNLNITGNFYQNGSVYSGSTQWGSTGANIYFNTGSVGLGTLAPLGRLHMANPGTLNTNNVVFEVGTTADGINPGWSALNFNGYYNNSEVRINTSKNRWRLAIDQRSTTDMLFFDTYNGTTLTTIIALSSNGNVGIKTLSPHEELTIGTLGNISLTSNAFDTGKIIFGSAISGAYNTNSRYYIQRGGTSGSMNQLIIHTPREASNAGVNFMTTNQVSRLFINSSSGNIGISTTTPLYTLDVNGTFEVSNSNGLMMFASSGNVGIGTTNPSSKLTILSGNNEYMGILATGTTFANAGLFMSSTATSTSITNSGSIVMKNGPGDRKMQFWNNSAAIASTDVSYGFLNSSAQQIFSILDNGNIGIGTYTPSSTLDVNCTGTNSVTLRVMPGINSTGSLIFGRQDNVLRENKIISANSNISADSYLRFDVHSGTTAVETSCLLLRGDGNIGIGTTTPSYKLDVNGSVFLGVMPSLTISGSLRLGRQDSPSIRYHDLEYSTSTTQASSYMSIKLHDGVTTTSQREVIRFRADGNVGIGTTSPSRMLSLTGPAFNSMSGPHLWINTSDQTNPIFQMLNWSANNISMNFDMYYDGAFRNSGSSTAWQIYKLSNQLRFTYQNGTAGSSNGQNIALLLGSSGNIGVGTGTPIYKLDVGGSIRSTGDIFIGDGTTAEAITLWDIPGAAWKLTTGDYKLSIQNGTGGSTMNTRVTITSIGNVGIGTSTPVDLLNVSNGNISLSSDNSTSKGVLINQNSIWSGIEVEGAAGLLSTGQQIINFGVNTNRSKTWNSSYMGGWFRIDTRDQTNLPLFQWYKKDKTGGVETMMMTLHSTGNLGIGTPTPAYKLDVNGTIARSGVRLPRFDNGSFSGSSSCSIPILFNDTNYNYCEIKVSYVTSAVCNINISATSYVNAAMGFNECALTTVKWNAQGTPVYTTFTSVTSGLFANDVERLGINNNLIFRIVRATGTSTAGIRNHYSYDNVYCWSGVGTARGYGQGHIDNASVGGSPLQFITFTCSSGTVSGTYSTVHSY